MSPFRSPWRRLLGALLLTAALCSLGQGRARAQVIAEPKPPPWPDPKKFSRGFFASGELGALVFLGRTGRFAGPGPAFGARIGYDILRWLAVQGHVAGASSSATTPPPIEGQAFQTYLYTGEARLSVQLRRFALFAEGGAGAAQLSSNVLESVGVTDGRKLSLAVIAGGGLDYHTLNRHFSFGVGADYVWLAQFSGSHALRVDAYLRYTR